MEDIAIVKKKVTCPLCEHEFNSTRVTVPKLKLIKTDTDLRPYYKGIDSVPYEITTCENCGYSAFYSSFPVLNKDTTEKLKQALDNNFTPHTFNHHLTTDEGIEKFKLAILTAKAQEEPKSVISNLYLKLAWLFRVKEGSTKYEIVCLKSAYLNGREAFKEEVFPVLGINKSTFSYLLGDMCRRLKQFDEARKWLRNANSFHEASLTLKDRVKEVEQLIEQELEELAKKREANNQ